MQDLQRWSAWLERTSSPWLCDLPDPQSSSTESRMAYIDRFTDEHGNRRLVDRPLLGWMLEVNPNASDNLGPVLSHPTHDVRLWQTLCDPASPEMGTLFEQTSGPLVPEARSSGLETWTESELSALHALWHLGRLRHDESIMERCREAVRWHLAELQPDNGTNRPWAVHVFVWASDRLPDALLHAQTLTHNACVERGRPERFSALLMLDASRAMRTLLSSP